MISNDHHDNTILINENASSLPPSRAAEEASEKNGPRHTIYWVKKKDLDSKSAGNNTKQYQVGVKYTGDWVGNQKCGYGTQTWPAGHRYEGEWQSNRRHGKGTFWIARNQKNGTSKLEKQYSGDWNNDTRHGVGVCYYENGGRYEGSFEFNRRHGRGRMEYSDKSIYDGEWYDNERSGLGVLLLPDGNRYDGHWFHDVKEGPGRFYYHSTQKVYEGEWHDGSAKCGVYRDISAAGGTEENFTLPALGLKNPESVLGEEIAKLHQKRVEMVTAAAADDDDDNAMPTFTEEDLKTLRAEFQLIETPYGRISCDQIFSILDRVEISGIQGNVDARDVESLLLTLGATTETEITFAEFVDITALLFSS